MSLVKFFADKQSAEDMASAMDKIAGVPIAARPITPGVHVDQEFAQTQRICEAVLQEDEDGNVRWSSECFAQAESRRVKVGSRDYVINLAGATEKKSLDDARRVRKEAVDYAAEEELKRVRR